MTWFWFKLTAKNPWLEQRQRHPRLREDGVVSLGSACGTPKVDLLGVVIPLEEAYLGMAQHYQPHFWDGWRLNMTIFVGQLVLDF